MFLLIPFTLIIVSVGGIIFVVWRKLPRLKEIVETESSNVITEKSWRDVLYDLCPEVREWIKNINVSEYKEIWLVETEKILRRLRVASMKMDRFSYLLIKKIRKKVDSDNEPSFASNETKGEGVKTKDEEKIELKRTEQRLILEIAKNPKDSNLYEELGDLYLKQESFHDAKESYEAAIEISPDNEELKKKLSGALEKLNPVKLSQNNHGASKPDGSQN